MQVYRCLARLKEGSKYTHYLLQGQVRGCFDSTDNELRVILKDRQTEIINLAISSNDRIYVTEIDHVKYDDCTIIDFDNMQNYKEYLDNLSVEVIGYDEWSKDTDSGIKLYAYKEVQYANIKYLVGYKTMDDLVNAFRECKCSLGGQIIRTSTFRVVDGVIKQRDEDVVINSSNIDMIVRREREAYNSIVGKSARDRAHRYLVSKKVDERCYRQFMNHIIFIGDNTYKAYLAYLFGEITDNTLMELIFRYENKDNIVKGKVVNDKICDKSANDGNKIYALGCLTADRQRGYENIYTCNEKYANIIRGELEKHDLSRSGYLSAYVEERNAISNNSSVTIIENDEQLEVLIKVIDILSIIPKDSTDLVKVQKLAIDYFRGHMNLQTFNYDYNRYYKRMKRSNKALAIFNILIGRD